MECIAPYCPAAFVLQVFQETPVMQLQFLTTPGSLAHKYEFNFRNYMLRYFQDALEKGTDVPKDWGSFTQESE